MSHASGWVVFGYKPASGDEKQPKDSALSAPMSSQPAAEHYRELCIREGYVVTGIRYVLSREATKRYSSDEIPKWRGAIDNGG